MRAAAAGLDRLDVLVNNAAILYDTWQRGVDADLDQVREAFETNLLGAWRVTQAVLPLLRASPAARIVNVSSGAGALHDMGGGTPAYSTSKAALNALTRILAAELRGDGILVNADLPRLGGDRHGRRGRAPGRRGRGRDRVGGDAPRRRPDERLLPRRAPDRLVAPGACPTSASSTAPRDRPTAAPLAQSTTAIAWTSTSMSKSRSARTVARAGRWSPKASTHASL